MTYEQIQCGLTVFTEIIAIAGTAGIIAHAFWKSHKSWMTEHCPPIAHTTPEPKVQEEIATESPQTETLEELFEKVAEICSKSVYQEEEEVTPPIPTAEVAKKPVTPRKPRRKEKLRAMSLGAASTDYAVMSSQQLRKECAARGVNWRAGGDYGRPMKKTQMISALG
jgi:hypothetical protein